MNQEEQVERPKSPYQDPTINLQTDYSHVKYDEEHIMDASFNPSKLHPLDINIISKQATINIGTIGHVAHGKSTVVKAISGVQTVRFKNELERNITIKLGYANAKIYKCNSDACPAPGCYTSRGSAHPDVFDCTRATCTGKFVLKRHVSFVDCPGHDILMATMLNGAAIMDAALLLVAGNEPCPQPQTSEHLAAVEVMKLKHLLILQNKIDIVKKESAQEQYKQILKFVKGTPAENSLVVPVSAQHKYNIDCICEYICTMIPIPTEPRYHLPARLIIVRSFDVNKPGFNVNQLVGGVTGGSIVHGSLQLNQIVEIRPGIVTKSESGKSSCQPLKTKVITLYGERNQLQFAVAGGLIAVGTTLDPALCRGDRMVGQILGAIGTLPNVYTTLNIRFHLLTRYLGVRSATNVAGGGAGGEEASSNSGGVDLKEAKIPQLKKNDNLLVNIGSLSTGCRVLNVKDDTAVISLNQPVCAEINSRLALSRKLNEHWRLIGWANMLDGETIETPEPV